MPCVSGCRCWLEAVSEPHAPAPKHAMEPPFEACVGGVPGYCGMRSAVRGTLDATQGDLPWRGAEPESKGSQLLESPLPWVHTCPEQVRAAVKCQTSGRVSSTNCAGLTVYFASACVIPAQAARVPARIGRTIDTRGRGSLISCGFRLSPSGFGGLPGPSMIPWPPLTLDRAAGPHNLCTALVLLRGDGGRAESASDLGT